MPVPVMVLMPLLIEKALHFPCLRNEEEPGDDVSTIISVELGDSSMRVNEGLFHINVLNSDTVEVTK